jgi:hypothetical protein
MTPVFVDDATGLTFAAPALEGGLLLHLRTPPPPHVLKAKAQWMGLVRARSDDPLQRIEHLSGGRLHPREAHRPHGATPRLPSDLPAQILPDDLMSPLKLRIVSSPVAWQSQIHTHVRVATRVHLCPLFPTRGRASPLTTNSLAHLNLISVHSHRFLVHPKTIADRASRALLFYN